MNKKETIFDMTTKADGSIELDPEALKGLKKMPIDIFDNVYLGAAKQGALALCIDIRGFSDFLRDHDQQTVFNLITSFTSNFLSCVNQFGYGCSYYKLLGDGALIIWDETSRESVREALAVFDTYLLFTNEELFGPYPGLGMGGALVQDMIYKYEISAEASMLKYRDYVGYGINLACRIQGLAGKNQLIVNKILADQKYFKTSPANNPLFLAEVTQLKGLKDEDKECLYFYVPEKT